MSRDLQRLQGRHQQIAELYLQGLPGAEIAQHMGLTANSVSRIIASPLFQGFISRRRRELQLSADEDRRTTALRTKEALAAAGLGAVQTLVDLTKSESENVRLKSAEEILRLAFEHGDGHSGPKGQVVNAGVVNIQLLQNALAEAREGEDVEALEGELIALPEPEEEKAEAPAAPGGSVAEEAQR